MCLIIASETGTIPTADLIKRAHKQNPHGFGVVWADNGKLTVYRGFYIRELLRLMPQIAGMPYVLHFRLATHGNIDIGNTHPFRITRRCYMAHNGIIKNLKLVNPDKSDTWHYAQLVKERLDGHLETLADWAPIFAKEITWANKLAFLTADGNITIVNESQGLRLDGMWLSNEWPLTKLEGLRATYADDYYNMDVCDNCGDYVEHVYKYPGTGNYEVCATCWDFMEREDQKEQKKIDAAYAEDDADIDQAEAEYWSRYAVHEEDTPDKLKAFAAGVEFARECGSSTWDDLKRDCKLPAWDSVGDDDDKPRRDEFNQDEIRDDWM